MKSSQLAECKDIDTNTYKIFLQDDNVEEKNIDKSRTSKIRASVTKLSSLGGQKEHAQEAKKGFQKFECELISEV